MKFQNEQLSVVVETVTVDGVVWFRGKDVAKALDYSNPQAAIRTNVDDDDRTTLDELQGVHLKCTQGCIENCSLTWNEKQMVFINESGLYSLILSSRKAEAKQFKKWATSEVLPSIRKTGSFAQAPPVPRPPPIQIINEKDLHYKVVNFIRRFYPDAIVIAGLGELQGTTEKRADAFYKGYVGGQPDIMILNKHNIYPGFAIELKTPTGKGVLSTKQSIFSDALKDNNYKTLVSNDYDEILAELVEYCRDVRVQCRLCCKCFKSKETLTTHSKVIHRIDFDAYKELKQ